MNTPAAVTVLAWDRLVRAGGVSVAAAQAGLKSAGMPPFEWYDALTAIERRGPVRPRDLQADLMIEQYNLSRLLDRLEQADLIGRTACADDGRGHTVELTEAGRALRASIWPFYASAIEQVVGTRLDKAESVQLAGLLARLL